MTRAAPRRRIGIWQNRRVDGFEYDSEELVGPDQAILFEVEAASAGDRGDVPAQPSTEASTAVENYIGVISSPDDEAGR
ncbi:MAG: hypothetical protein QM582_02250 [Micropruina sp.]|uniref:hypothetical protein n=1 Tax=Micropruina sp. TaxID=2737536 RepID=UPI0039E37C79